MATELSNVQLSSHSPIDKVIKKVFSHYNVDFPVTEKLRATFNQSCGEWAVH